MAAQPGSETQADLLNLPQPSRLTILASRLQEASLASEVTVASAESCTGGLLGHAITEVAGSSAYYLGGVISYSNEVKVGSLGVDPAAIERHGAVSAQVARSMANGIRSRLGSDYSVAVTGVAGPGGGSLDKPVGLTYVAAAGPSSEEVRRHHWSGDRSSNKQDSVEAALELLLEVISADSQALPGEADPATDE